MARTRLTPVVAPRTHPGGSVAYTFTAHDTVNEMDFVPSGNDLLLIESSDAGSQDVLVHSAPDSFGREEDVTISVAAGATHAMAFTDRAGWMQTDGAVHIDCTVATIGYAVIRLP